MKASSAIAYAACFMHRFDIANRSVSSQNGNSRLCVFHGESGGRVHRPIKTLGFILLANPCRLAQSQIPGSQK